MGLDEVEGGGEVAGVEGGFVKEAGAGFGFGVCEMDVLGGVWIHKFRSEDGRRTIWIELQDLQVHICVRNDEMELLVKGQEIHCDGF